MSGGARTRPLTVGEPLPPFSGTTATGRTLGRADLLGRPAVVFFYPKAASPGCTLEAREFARLHPAFESAGATVVGVSVDPVEAERSFRDHCELPFDLVADEGRAISRAFGVLGALRMARRTTFVVGPDGAVVAVIRSWRPKLHAEQALASLGGTLSARPAEPAAPKNPSP
jgi:thioredoxin-dependent peroxiredoxin